MHLFLCGRNCIGWASKCKVEGTDDVGEFTLGEHHCRTLTEEEIEERMKEWEEENTFVRYEEVIKNA